MEQYTLYTHTAIFSGADWQEDKKLNLILSKVQEHQSSLRAVSPINIDGKVQKIFTLSELTLCQIFSILGLKDSDFRYWQFL